MDIQRIDGASSQQAVFQNSQYMEGPSTSRAATRSNGNISTEQLELKWHNADKTMKNKLRKQRQRAKRRGEPIYRLLTGEGREGTSERQKKKCKCSESCWIVLGDILTPVDEHDKEECLFHNMKFSTVEEQINHCFETEFLKEPLEKYKRKHLATLRQFQALHSGTTISIIECDCSSSGWTCWIIDGDVLKPVNRHYEGRCLFHRMEFSAVEVQVNNCLGTEFIKEPLKKYKQMYLEPPISADQVAARLQEVSERLEQLKLLEEMEIIELDYQ
ncbi:uncharacterized protein LOC123688925 [Harmonia axyridis]|uniref:uncharacterized protein LOC123688925 n=1 Tax=Harmonia axyridis TaxID=115357 RepID=UPI001E2771D5|nr:uncharacterized protein LOC123688925 [Harmonia axyridis]XP_045483636.1 uncharacterized protein LOC123688925 [Harmonia axyridis]